MSTFSSFSAGGYPRPRPQMPIQPMTQPVGVPGTPTLQSGVAAGQGMAGPRQGPKKAGKLPANQPMGAMGGMLRSGAWPAMQRPMTQGPVPVGPQPSGPMTAPNGMGMVGPAYNQGPNGVPPAGTLWFQTRRPY